MSAPVRRGGRPRRVNDDLIVEMLGMAGTIVAAARALGYTVQGLRRRASTSPAVAGAMAAKGRRRSGRKSSAPSRDELLALLAEHGGDNGVARHLHRSPGTVGGWREAYGIPAMPRQPTARLSVAEVVRGLDAAPSAQEGAEALGYTKQALYLRAKTSPEIRDALTRAAQRGTARALATEAIRDALNAALTLGEAAEALGISEAALSMQVNQRALSAELGALKARGREARRRVSDNDIVEAFRQHGVFRRVVEALGIGTNTLFVRLRDPAIAAAVAPYRRDGRARSEAA